ncbi:Holliday junction branch migration protein RuvA [Sabulicella rubraurantiaca]|uniref:Holliday junction branch migration protein RuvA n=1 Tax=Sabulicella rubraurantiaca TaxID=2811429 RepID=UPI001A9649D2|nr:Holliday junction branch migration protein RuvA [Sabulicella rubraurantiaca]
MFASLTGLVQSTGDGACVLDVNGVGYLVSCSRKTLDRLTAKEGVQRLLVETRVAQDSITLYGFLDAAERDAFRALTQVKTVGPQKALLVLSGLSPADLARAIAGKERKRLGEVKGVGAATATRIVDEPAMQKWAVGKATPDADGVGGVELPSAGSAQDAVSALLNLGLKRPEAEKAVAKAMKALGEEVDLNALITAALRESAR